MRHRVTLGCGVVAALVAVLAPPAAAGPKPGAYVDEGGDPTATVTSTTVSAGGSSGSGGGGYCTYEDLPTPEPTYELFFSSEEEGGENLYGTSTTGRWYTQTCFNELGQQVSSMIIPAVDGGAGPVVDPQELLEDARARLRVPGPSLGINPPVGSSSFVRVPVWLWVDSGYWQPQEATASAGGASATVTAEPVSAVWDMGDGTVIPCAGPGTPWSAQLAPDAVLDCSHTYLRASAAQPRGSYPVSVTVTWSVAWTSTVPGFGGGLDDLLRTSTADITVAEVQALAQ